MTTITQEEILSSGQLAGRVTRFHTWPMIRKPTVAEHSHRVAVLLVEVFGELPRAELLYAALVHDYGELTAGDVPHYAKREVPELAEALEAAEAMGALTLGHSMPELDEEERERLKICDLLEMRECATVERRMGNRYADAVIANVDKALYRIHAMDRTQVRRFVIRMEEAA